MRCLINHIQDKDRFLNRAADKTLKTILQAVEAEPALLVIVLPQLVGGHGAYNFDKVTKTKTIEKLLNFVDSGNAAAVIEDLVEPAFFIVR
jgi:DNA polymerase phi